MDLLSRDHEHACADELIHEPILLPHLHKEVPWPRENLQVNEFVEIKAESVRHRLRLRPKHLGAITLELEVVTALLTLFLVL